MYRTALTMVFLASALFAQSPQQLLCDTAKNYRQLDSIEIKGHLTTPMLGTRWVVRCEAISAAAGHKFVPPDSPWPSFDRASQFGKCEYIKQHSRGTGSEGQSVADSEKPPIYGWAMPGAWGDYRKLDAGVKSARLLGSETLNVAGERIPCDVVEVVYESKSGAAPKTIQYWISPDRHLVFRQKFAEVNVVQHNTVYHWTYTVDSVTLNQPPPQWLVDAYQDQVGKTRQEWNGRMAPDFTLTDLTGGKTTLSALHGKAVLLDFWGTYCGPCKEEMPTVEKLRDEYRDRGLEVWGVTDDSAEKAQRFLSDNHRSLPTLMDHDRSVFKKYKIEGIPVVILIGRDGKVAQFWEGMQYEKDIQAALEVVLR